MQRNLTDLMDGRFDVVVVGGGIYGACTAWDAASRGLRVALLEQRDFAHATSANSFKMVHGGIRYLQHADIRRVRGSSRERRAFLRIAPHLVEPLPILIPTYGHGWKGKEILAIGAHAYDLLTVDRNRGIPDPARRIPRSRMLSPAECLDRFPDLDSSGLTGGVLFHDAQMYNPTRLAFSFVKAAARAGAIVANHTRAVDFDRRADRIVGVEVEDRLSGDRFPVRARVVVNTAGPWAEALVEQRLGLEPPRRSTFSRDTYFVVPRRLTGPTGLAVLGQSRDPDAIVSREARHLFVVPWRDVTLIGVWHGVHDRAPDDFEVTDRELRSYLAEVNESYPPLDLTVDDVSACHAGLVLFGENEKGARDLSYGKRSRVIDHARTHDIEGLITVIGVRYTTARSVAEKVIDAVFAKLEEDAPPSRTETTALPGGRIDDIEGFIRDLVHSRRDSLAADVATALARNHGSEVDDVLRLGEEDPTLIHTIDGTTVIRAEIVFAAREEMARTLSDAVYRRTDLGTGRPPSDAALAECADLMADELGWTQGRRDREIAAARSAVMRPVPVPAGTNA